MTDKEQKEKLKEFLAQYKIVKLRRDQLKKRHKLLKEDLENPLKGVKYGGMPTNHLPSTGAASIIYRIAEIEERILLETEKMTRAVNEVLDILDYLPDDSEGKLILELKYIDCMEWLSIAENMYISRSQCFRLEDRALSKLLTYERVREKVAV